MEMDDLIIGIQEPVQGDMEGKREQLMAIALTGKTKTFLNENLTPEQVKVMSDADVIKKHDLYMSSLGSKLAKGLSSSMISVYSKAVNYFFPGTRENDLSYDLSKNPVVSDMLGSLSASLYVKFGILLSPIIIAIITASHIQLKEEEEEKKD